LGFSGSPANASSGAAGVRGTPGAKQISGKLNCGKVGDREPIGLGADFTEQRRRWWSHLLSHAPCWGLLFGTTAGFRGEDEGRLRKGRRYEDHLA
jgi:hypothetical protein